MMKRLGIVLSLALFSWPAVAAPPASLGKRDRDLGYEWVAASRVLTSDGFLKSAGVHERLRRYVELELQGSATDHGLENGEVPETDRWCVREPVSGLHLPSEQDGRFVSLLLLSEVAVAATLGDAVPGFLDNGNPAVLFALSDVVPLHGRSPSVGYVLVPFDRLVIHGRVFCASHPAGYYWSRKGYRPEVGDRVVVMGGWSSDAVLRTGTWWRNLGELALVRDKEVLQWGSRAPHDAPRDLTGLYERVDEAVTGRLFELTTHLVSQEYGSPARRDFVETWRRHEPNGCRVVEVADTPGEGLVPVRTRCPSRKAER